MTVNSQTVINTQKCKSSENLKRGILMISFLLICHTHMNVPKGGRNKVANLTQFFESLYLGTDYLCRKIMTGVAHHKVGWKATTFGEFPVAV
jgi:hypothetical protein